MFKKKDGGIKAQRRRIFSPPKNCTAPRLMDVGNVWRAYKLHCLPDMWRRSSATERLGNSPAAFYCCHATLSAVERSIETNKRGLKVEGSRTCIFLYGLHLICVIWSHAPIPAGAVHVSMFQLLLLYHMRTKNYLVFRVFWSLPLFAKLSSYLVQVGVKTSTYKRRKNFKI